MNRIPRKRSPLGIGVEASVAEKTSKETSAHTVAWTSNGTDSHRGRNAQEVLFFAVHSTGKEARETVLLLAEAETAPRR